MTVAEEQSSGNLNEHARSVRLTTRSTPRLDSVLLILVPSNHEGCCSLGAGPVARETEAVLFGHGDEARLPGRGSEFEGEVKAEDGKLGKRVVAVCNDKENTGTQGNCLPGMGVACLGPARVASPGELVL